MVNNNTIYNHRCNKQPITPLRAPVESMNMPNSQDQQDSKPAVLPGNTQNGAELLVASALTSLKPQDETTAKKDDNKEDEAEFKFPVRYTKTGRKKSTPFPMKVSPLVEYTRSNIQSSTIHGSCYSCLLLTHICHLSRLQLMEALSQKKWSHIISWTPDGKAFQILRPGAFKAQVLPKVIKESDASIFLQTLKKWGFRRHFVNGSDDVTAFYHDSFQKGKPQALSRMTSYDRQPQPHPVHAARIQVFQARRSARDTESLAIRSDSHRQAHREIISLAGSGVSLPEQRVLPSSPSSVLNLGIGSSPTISTEEQLRAVIDREVTWRLKAKMEAEALEKQARSMAQLAAQAQEQAEALQRATKCGPDMSDYQKLGLW